MGDLDIGLKLTIGVAAATVGAAAVILPSKKQKDSAALKLFDKTFNECDGTEKRSADFYAGHQRWTNFVENSIYSWTRKLPGSNKPFLNPYKEAERKFQEVEDEE